jgi:hypothetical protein
VVDRVVAAMPAAMGFLPLAKQFSQEPSILTVASGFLLFGKEI